MKVSEHVISPIPYPGKHVFKNLNGNGLFDREEAWQLMKWVRRNRMIDRKPSILPENEVDRIKR